MLFKIFLVSQESYEEYINVLNCIVSVGTWRNRTYYKTQQKQIQH